MIGALLWGLAPAAAKGSLTACSPEFLSTFRLAISAVIFRLAAGGSARWFVADPWVWVAGIALGLDFTLYSQGLRHTPASEAGLLVNLEPVATILLAVWLLGERLTLHRVAGSLTTLLGVGLVSASSIASDAPPDDLRRLGALLVMASSLAWSVYAVAQRRTDLGPTIAHRLTAIFGVATLVTLPGLLAAPAREFHADPVGWAFLLLVTFLCTSTVYLLYARAQQLLDVSVLAVLLCPIPVASLGFAALLLGEPVTLSLVLAAALVSAGVWIIAHEPT